LKYKRYVTAARSSLSDYLGARHPLLASYPFLFAKALYIGLFPRLLATALAAMAAIWCIEPLAQRASIDLWSLVIFIPFCTIVSFVGETRHRACFETRANALRISCPGNWLNRSVLICTACPRSSTKQFKNYAQESVHG
jgi:hypothetical protein